MRWDLARTSHTFSFSFLCGYNKADKIVIRAIWVKLIFLHETNEWMDMDGAEKCIHRPCSSLYPIFIESLIFGWQLPQFCMCFCCCWCSMCWRAKTLVFSLLRAQLNSPNGSSRLFMSMSESFLLASALHLRR